MPMAAVEGSGTGLVTAVSTAVAPLGLNLVGAVSIAAYDAGLAPQQPSLAALAPDAHSVLVLGHGGGAFWTGFAAHVSADPARPDPLDAYTRAAIGTALADCLPASSRLIFPFEFPTVPVSFQRLAVLAGLGSPSLLGVLVHPEFGPWIALRAAVLVPIWVTAPAPAAGFDPCPTCVERACIASCPAGAVTSAGWNIPACAAHRARPDDPCAVGCHARIDCVIGRAHRYPAAAQVHHQAYVRPGLLAVAR